MSCPRNPSGHFSTTTIRLFLLLAVILAATLCQAANPPACTTGILPKGAGEDIDVTNGTCFVDASNSPYNYGNINIYGGGTLCFVDSGDGKNIDFWAKSILVEDNGSLLSSDATKCAGGKGSVFGNSGATLTIHLYGPEQGTGVDGTKQGIGVQCHSKSDGASNCGIPDVLWGSNSMDHMNPPPCTHAKDVPGYGQNLPGNVDDCFYGYMPLEYDGGGTTPGYFGYKVLAVSYNGTLQLLGKKGAVYDARQPSDSGNSWARLATDITPRTSWDHAMELDRFVDWVPGDKIVVSSSDYLPGHAEQFTIQQIFNNGATGSFILFTAYTSDNPQGGARYFHNGTTYNLGSKNIPNGIGPDQDPNVQCTRGQTHCIETRAAVGLLTRSIRIVSEGDTYGTPLASPQTAVPCKSPPDPKQPLSCLWFGGHTIVRQGFAAFQMQGVEFYQLGQGERIMHYPVHFHMARKTPQPANPGDAPVTFVSDSSVWDSMTRWMTLHATQGVTLARNVGYKSIGAGYYLEDGSETNNKLYSNLGVFARAAIQNPQNPRQVPGILGQDLGNPTVFWMMNGWNDFEYNMASGAGTCGMCYWLVPGRNSGHSQYEYWDGYAGLQQGDPSRDGITPLRKFMGNACSSAQYSFNTVGGLAPCYGIDNLKPINNILPHDNPLFFEGDFRKATKCDDSSDCRQVIPCAYTTDGSGEKNCEITDIDHYTTSFHWAETNFGALWLRSQWYLLTNSAITDVQNGGLTFVSGGGYSGADEVTGYWALAHKDVFVGNTQTHNPLASNAGPFNPQGLACDGPFPLPGYCANRNEGVTFPLNNFSNAQRLFSIYDGPSYQESNAFLDITPTGLINPDSKPCSKDLTDCTGWASSQSKGVPYDPVNSQCYLPNAAIAWKQPNGFYYPPAFHSSDLYFNNVAIRHYLVQPLFQTGTFQTDLDRATARYCGQGLDALFNGFTDIDRQTELSDDDGSLTGLKAGDRDHNPVGPSISVNKDVFFSLPLETAECKSDILDVMPPPLGKQACPYSKYPELCATANTSPYDYVTAVVYPGPDNNTPDAPWTPLCENPNCYGATLTREETVPGEHGPSSILMMGQNTLQRSNLTVNHGRFYLNTNVSKMKQDGWGRGETDYTVFGANGKYYLFLMFGKTTITQTYDVYVGTDFVVNSLRHVQVNAKQLTGTNTPGTAFTDHGPFDCSDMSKECSFDKPAGYLTVTLDLSTADFEGAKEDACGPVNFCTFKNGACGCNPDQQSASPDECKNACENWSTKDVRCPKGGCFGFAFTLPSTFVADDSKGAPYTKCFAKNDDWDIGFAPPDPKGPGAGSCDYGTILPGPAQFCSAAQQRGLLYGNGIGLTETRNQR